VRGAGAGDPGAAPVRELSRRSWLIIAASAVVVAFLVSFVIWPAWGYHLDWTGLGASRSPVKSPKALFDYYPSKTLWDWMQLLVVPVVLAGAALWFNAMAKRRDETIAEDRQQAAVLDAYLATMTTLLIDKGLKGSAMESAPRAVARAQTLTVVERLNGQRKGSVVRFLYESHLIDKDEPIVALRGADLRGADLRRAMLMGATLRGADLRRAMLIGAVLKEAALDGATLAEATLNTADLTGADLIGANLPGADLTTATLDGADLTGATLTAADLTGATLIGATLTRANLIRATLDGVDLARANLTAARGKTNEELEEQAARLTDATMPDGEKHW